MTRRRILKACAVCALAGLVAAGCSRKEEKPAPKSDYVFEPVRIQAAYLALLERPDAQSALLLGAEAKRLAPYLRHAGVKTLGAGEGKADLLVIACDEMSPDSLSRALAHVKAHGAVAWIVDVDGVTAGVLRERLEAFGLEEAHLWMPGATRWLVTARRKGGSVPLGEMLELLARESAFEDLARARVEALSDFFASYVGRLRDVSGVFGSLGEKAIVRPANFLTRDVPPIGWLSAEGVDHDIAHATLAEIRSMQVVRRLVVEGNLASDAARDRKGEEKATSTWARAYKRNPRDLFLLERLDRLQRNARGFLEVNKVLQAMKCYETMILIAPDNVHAVNSFGQCLEKIGKKDLAGQVLERAKTLSKRVGAIPEQIPPSSPRRSRPRQD